MNIEIRREHPRALGDYAAVPIAFEIHEVVALESLRLGSPLFRSQPVRPPRVKDYDAHEGNAPPQWAARFVVDSWTVLAASDGEALRVGGAVVICDAQAIIDVGGRPSYAVLWDIRVAPAVRGRGVGRALLEAAESVARAACCRGVDAETQDVNVGACRLYAAHGYSLSALRPGAYADAPAEAQLIWTKELV